MLSLLVYLVVESQALHRRDALAALLWPDQPHVNARHSLRQALTTLRRVVADADASAPLILTEGDGVGFNITGDCRIDIIEFDRLLDDSATHAHGRLDRCVACARRHEQAIALYRGELCSGTTLGDSLDFDAWMQQQRERFHRKAMTAFTALGAFLEHTGRDDEARKIVVRQLELDPWQESAHRALMHLHFRAGNRAAALQQYEKCRVLLEEELGLDPEPETIELYEQIRAGPSATQSAPRPTPSRPVALPEPLTPLVGRHHEMSEVTDLLTLAECRLLTLVGPGGMGKTRLALQVARELAGTFAHGAYFVPLTPVRTVDLLSSTITDALGLTHPGRGDPAQHLVNQLRDRQVLLVLDGMEHLLAGDSLITTLLAHAPDLRVLVTSRERLGLQAEWLYPLSGLAVPPADGDDTDHIGSVELFAERLRRVRPQHPLQAEERPAVGRICRLVEGMPLAIELAAAWASTLSVDDIAREIEQSIDFLEIPLRDLPPRHRSMRAVFDQSWELLSPEQQSVFQRLSIFRGGFSRAAAEYVAGATPAVLSSLMSTSFLRATANGRYFIHELLRQYGEHQLGRHQREDLRARDRFSRYFLSFVAEREDSLTGRNQKEAVAEITSEIANLRHAWHIALQLHSREPVNQAMHALWLFYVIRGWMREGEAVFGEAVSAFAPEDDAPEPAPPDIVLAKALTRQGGFASGLGSYDPASELLQRGIAMLRALDARRELALALNFMAAATHLAGTPEEERAFLEEGLVVFRETGDLWGEAYVLNDLGMLAHAQGDAAKANELCRESQRIFRQINDVRGLAFTAHNLGVIASARGDTPTARTYHEQALALRRESEDQWGIAASLLHLGASMRIDGDREGARATLIEALRMARAAWVLPVALDVLVELAALLAEEGDTFQAGEMLAIVMNDSAASRQIQQRSGALLSQVEQELDEFHRMELHERAASSSVDALALSFLP